MPLVEKRYAEALIDISKDVSIDAYQQELQGIVEVYKNDQDFRLFLLNPEIKIDTKKLVVKNIFGGRIKIDLVNFILLLLDKGRISVLPGILDEYVKIADKLRDTLNITIISATPLEDTQIKDILEKYRKKYNAANTKVTLEIDVSLIGGVKVKIADKVFDGSIIGRLESLKELLVKG